MYKHLLSEHLLSRKWRNEMKLIKTSEISFFFDPTWTVMKIVLKKISDKVDLFDLRKLLQKIPLISIIQFLECISGSSMGVL